MGYIGIRACAAALFVASAAAQLPAQLPSCQACHGVAGISDSPGIPNLAGQKGDYLFAQLQAFQRGDRKNELMAAIARQLSETEMRSLARFWSEQSPGGAVAPGAQAQVIASQLRLPADFPHGFTVYETVVSSEDRLVIKRHANTAALQAAREGRPLPDGAMLVVVNHALAHDSQGQPVAGAVRGYSAMAARADWGAQVPELLRNGNWDYALFNAQGARDQKLNPAPCLACHKPMADDSFVFTMKALREHALR
jgi:cytochrome c553